MIILAVLTFVASAELTSDMDQATRSEEAVGGYGYYMYDHECPGGFTKTGLRGMADFGWTREQAKGACGGKEPKGYGRNPDGATIKLCCGASAESEVGAFGVLNAIIDKKVCTPLDCVNKCQVDKSLINKGKKWCNVKGESLCSDQKYKLGWGHYSYQACTCKGLKDTGKRCDLKLMSCKLEKNKKECAKTCCERAMKKEAEEEVEVGGECDSIRTGCCALVDKANVTPGQSWGSANEAEKKWWDQSQCDKVTGGMKKDMWDNVWKVSLCPYSCDGCDLNRKKCCEIPSRWTLKPGVTWGNTPTAVRQFWNDHNCDASVGGAEMINCPYECKPNKGDRKTTAKPKPSTTPKPKPRNLYKCYPYRKGQDDDWCKQRGAPFVFTGGKNDDFPGCANCVCCLANNRQESESALEETVGVRRRICKLKGRVAGKCDRRKGSSEWDSCNLCKRGSRWVGALGIGNHWCCTEEDQQNHDDCTCYKFGGDATLAFAQGEESVSHSWFTWGLAAVGLGSLLYGAGRFYLKA